VFFALLRHIMSDGHGQGIKVADLQLREVIPDDLQCLYRVRPGLTIPFRENGEHTGFVKD
jgi:hypothetical protein